MNTNINSIVYLEGCNACSSGEVSRRFSAFNTHGRSIIDRERVFEYAECACCGNVYLNRISADIGSLSEYYTEGYYGNESPSLLVRLYSRLSFFVKQRLVLSALGRRKGKIKLCDVGCGSGGFLKSLSCGSFDAYGLEPNIEGVKLCRGQNMEVFHGTLDTMEPQTSFDVLTLWHVLEHIKDPVEAFRAAAGKLNDGGIIVMSVPNVESLGFRLGQEYWFHFDAPRHVFLPTSRSLELIGQAAGFELLRVSSLRFEFPLDLFWSVRHSSLKWLICALYPLAKIVSRETLIGVFQKKGSK